MRRVLADALSTALRPLCLPLLLLLAVASAPAAASAGDDPGRAKDPEAVVFEVVTDALERLAADPDTLREDGEAARAFFDEHVLPWVDIRLMARFALGRAARQASADELERFTRALERRVATLYVRALQRYAEEAADFAREGEVILRTVSQEDDRAIIAATLRGPHVEDLSLRVQLYHRDARWRVFDIETSGVSMLLVFRDALRDAARDGGVEAMIAALEQGSVQVEEAWEAETAD